MCTQFFNCVHTQFLNLFNSFWHLWFDRKSFSLWQICFYGDFWNYSTVKSELKVVVPIWGLALLYFALLLLPFYGRSYVKAITFTTWKYVWSTKTSNLEFFIVNSFLLLDMCYSCYSFFSDWFTWIYLYLCAHK